MADLTGKSVVQLKAEINELRCQFMREHKKAKRRVTGQSADAVYVSKWYLYADMLFFADRAATRRTIGNVAAAQAQDDTDDYAEQQIDDAETHEVGSESVQLRFASTIGAPSGTQHSDDADLDARSATGSRTSISTHTEASSSRTAHEFLFASPATVPEGTKRRRKETGDPTVLVTNCLERLIAANRESRPEDEFAAFGRFIGDSLRAEPTRYPELKRKIVAVMFDLYIPDGLPQYVGNTETAE